MLDEMNLINYIVTEMMKHLFDWQQDKYKGKGRKNLKFGVHCRELSASMIT